MKSPCCRINGCWPCDCVRNFNRIFNWIKCVFKKFHFIHKCGRTTRNVSIKMPYFLSEYIKFSCCAQRDANRLNIPSCRHCRPTKMSFLVKLLKTLISKSLIGQNQKVSFMENLILHFYKMRQLRSQWERSSESGELMNHRLFTPVRGEDSDPRP